MLRSEEGLKGITAPPLSPRIVVEELTPKPFGREGLAGAAEVEVAPGVNKWQQSQHNHSLSGEGRGGDSPRCCCCDIKFRCPSSTAQMMLRQWWKDERYYVCVSTQEKGDICLKFMAPSSGNLSFLWDCDHQVQQGLTWVLAFPLHTSLTEFIIEKVLG